MIVIFIIMKIMFLFKNPKMWKHIYLILNNFFTLQENL